MIREFAVKPSLLTTTCKRLPRMNKRYSFSKFYDEFRVFARKFEPRTGTTRVVPIKIQRHTLCLEFVCNTGVREVVEFKYTHTSRHGWGWTDSRVDGRQTTSYVVSEISRMLFNKRIEPAKLLVNRTLKAAHGL